MAALTIRSLDDDLKRRLRQQAAANERSMEEEAREILRRGVVGTQEPREGLGTRLRRRFLESGGIELDVPPREAEAPRDAPE